MYRDKCLLHRINNNYSQQCWISILHIPNTSVRRILDHTDRNPSEANIKPLQYNVMGVWRCEFERLNTRATLQRAEFIIVGGVKELLEHPSLELRLTNAATWQKEAEFARIFKEITRKPNPSFQSKIFSFMSAGLFLVYQSPHSRLEVHLRNQVYVL